MFVYGQDLLEASCVTASLSACLVEPGTFDLVLVKGRTVEIYRKTVTSYHLYGIHKLGSAIKSAERLASPVDQVDSLMLSFDDCKVIDI